MLQKLVKIVQQDAKIVIVWINVLLVRMVNIYKPMIKVKLYVFNVFKIAHYAIVQHIVLNV